MKDSMTTAEQLETALDSEGWEPEYREAGDPLPYGSFEITVDERTIYVELTEIATDQSLALVRITEYDEEGTDLLETWDVEDLGSPESIVSEIKEFIESV